MSLDKSPVGQISVGQMLVAQMSVGQTFVGHIGKGSWTYIQVYLH